MGKAEAPSIWAPEPFRRISGTHDDIVDLGYLLPDYSRVALATNSADIKLVSETETETQGGGSAWDPDSPPYFGQHVALLKGHDETFISLDIDWSDHWIATGAKDNTAKLWHQIVKKLEIPRTAQHMGRKTGSCAVFTRKAHDKDINAINVRHSKLLFASASQDKTVKIWSVEEGEVQGVLRVDKRGVWSVQFSPAPIQGEDGLSLERAPVLKVAWLNMSSGQDKSKSGIQFTSAGGDGLVKVWDANLGEAECALDNHEDRVWAVAVHPDNNTIVSGSGGSTVAF
ncbi:hypothetical protein LRP88_11560 [Fusarium phalaenopsidis]